MSVLGVVGAAIGGYFGGPQGAMLGYSIGSGVDSVINPPKIEGPRLEDLEVQMASYGSAIPFEYGTNRHAGTVIWPKLIELTEHEHEESAKGGPEMTTYTYTTSFAVLICEGPIAGVRRIWANKKLIYDVSTGVGVPEKPPEPADPDADPVTPGDGDGDNGMGGGASGGASQDPSIGSIRFYLGTDSQSPDPLIEAKDGPSPAYLGYAYAVFEDLDLTDFANRPPQLEFEVLTIGSEELPDATSMGPSGYVAAVDPNTGYIWSTRGFFGSHTTVYITDPATQSLINQFDIPNPGPTGQGNGICYIDSLNQFWVVNTSPGVDIFVLDAESQSFVTSWILGRLPYQCIVGSTIPVNLPWAQIIRYDKVHDRVLIGKGNLQATLWIFNPRLTEVSVDPCDSTKTFNHNLYPVAVHELPPNDNFAISNMWVAGGYAVVTTSTHVIVLQNGVIVQDLFIEELYDQSNGLTFDTKRMTLAIAPALTSRIITINALTGERVDREYTIEDAQPIASPNFISMAFRNILYHEQTDRYYVTAHSLAEGWTVHAIEPASLDIAWSRIYGGPGGSGVLLEVPDAPGYFVAVDGQTWRIPIGQALEPHPVILGDIVEDVCLRAGLSPAEIDVSQLTDEVDGYIVPRQMSGRSAIEPLQTAFFFDAVESDAKLKFVKRGAGSPITIPMEDRAAREFGADLPDSLSIVRAQDMELPVQVDVEYADIAADHLVGNQYSRRITKDTKSRVNIQSPVVMNAVKAKQVADVTLYRAWLNQSYKFTTTRKWSHLEPTDIVILPTQEASYTARIVSKREQPSGIIEWEAAMEGVEVYTQSGTGAAPTNYVKQSIYAPGSTLLTLLDIPMLRDEDNNAGFYDVMAGSGSSWTGAQLFKSADGGSTYEPIHITSDPATMGATQSALPDFTAGNIVDEGSSVTVVMKSGAALTSITDTQLFNGANLAVIGKPGRWEIIQFRTATLIAPKTYQLSGFLRGRRGTEWATGTHQAGDTFIIASPTGWSRLVANADVGLERKYKAPAFRMPLSSAPATTFTNTAIGLKPFSPVDLTGERDADGNLTLKWNRRTRLIGDTLHMARPLGEASEAYSIDILNGETVLRTLTSSTPSVVYSAADQAADGITPGAAVAVSIYQLSQAVGRGYPLQGTV